MEKALFVLSIALAAAHRQHPRFPRSPQDSVIPLYSKVECTSDNDHLRNEMIEKATCGEPKDVFVHLHPSIAHEQVIPGAVWVKRCVGLCEHGASDSSCVATKTKILDIPVRINNVKTDKESCATYQVEVHESCGCCAASSGNCPSRRVFDPPEPAYEVESI